LERFKYQFDNYMAKGTIALIGGLGVLSAIVIVSVAFIVWIFQISPGDGEPISFWEAAWEGLMRTLDAGTMGGADPNPAHHAGFPPLIAALSCVRAHPGTSAREDVLEVLKLLLAFGADPNQRGLNDFTPLHMAVNERYLPVAWSCCWRQAQIRACALKLTTTKRPVRSPRRRGSPALLNGWLLTRRTSQNELWRIVI
jgi:hypothetical protein